METGGETPAIAKGQRRKLKRVMQKKKKPMANLNSSTVAYYKKMKAAVNASLNSSRASHTLKANNIALAQSLQRVKQELRAALNEMSRLKEENQGLAVQLRHAENQAGVAQDQAFYKQRFQGLKSVLDTMSCHLLEMGTCVGSAVDLCKLAPSSRSSSRPQSLEECRIIQEGVEKMVEEELPALADASALLLEQSQCDEDMPPASLDEGATQTMAAVDMSIIMEQSLLDAEEGPAPLAATMQTVIEDTGVKTKAGDKKILSLIKPPRRVRNGPLAGADTDELSSKNRAGFKIDSSLSKLPKRVGNGPVSSLSAVDVEKEVSDNGDCWRRRLSPPATRRETFLVSRAPAFSDADSVEDIASIAMPDLVTGSPMKGVDMSEAVEATEPRPTEGSSLQVESVSPHPLKENSMNQANTATAQPSVEEGAKSRTKTSSPSSTEENQTKTKVSTGPSSTEKTKTKKSAEKSKRTSGGASSKDRRLSGGKITEAVGNVKPKGGACKAPVPAKSALKDTGFFITNPCALNLAHKRVTGSLEGCVDSTSGDRPKPKEAAANPVNQLFEEIKEANRKSSRAGSFFTADDSTLTSTGNVGSAADKLQVSGKTMEKPFSSAAVDDDTPDKTMFFDQDMEFTQILPQTQSLEVMAEQQEVEDQQEAPVMEKRHESRSRSKKSAEAEKTDSQKNSRSKSRSRAATVEHGPETAENEETDRKKNSRSKSRPRAAAGKQRPEAAENEGVDCKKISGSRSRSRAATSKQESEDEGSAETEVDTGDDKKSAVAMRSNKPGQMVFAAARKEDDGSRKAIPAKLPGKARSKSKKRMEELMKNLAWDEPETVFDFHDQTPRHIATEAKSVFDLSLNDTATGVAPSLAAFREKAKEATKGQEAEEENASAAPKENHKTVKGKQGKPVAPSILGNAPVYQIPLKDAASSSPEPQLQSRGRSESRGQETGRQSRSRSRSKKDLEETDNSNKTDRRSRSRAREEKKEEDSPEAVEGAEQKRKPRSRSRGRQAVAESSDTEGGDNSERPRQSGRSKGRIVYTEDAEATLLDLEEKGKSSRKSRSKASRDEEDNDYVPCKSAVKERQRGRSRGRKHEDQDGAEHKTEEDRKPQQNRGRSRSRLQAKEDASCEGKESASSCEDKICADPLTSKETDNLVNEPACEQANKGHSVKADSHNSVLADSESEAQPPIKMVTERRQRSKSAHRKLYSESDGEADPLAMSCDVTATDQISCAALLPVAGQKKARHRTRSRGAVLKEPSAPSQEDSASPTSCSRDQPEGAGEKRKSDEVHEKQQPQDIGSPNKKLCTSVVRKSQPGAKGSDTAVQALGTPADGLKPTSTVSSGKPSKGKTLDAAAALKKRRSSLPIPKLAVADAQQDKVAVPPTSKAEAKKTSRLQEPNAGEKNFALKFQDLKLKLIGLESRDSGSKSKPGPDKSSQPSKKSRPLVLPTSYALGSSSSVKGVKSPVLTDTNARSSSKAIARSKKGKSQPGTPTEKKESKSHQRSPASAVSTPASPLPHRADGSEDAEDGSNTDGRRGRRAAAAAVSYKEPCLNSKLRRGDPHTTFLHNEEMLHIYKSPKGPRKHGKSGRVERAALHDVTNMSIAELEVQ